MTAPLRVAFWAETTGAGGVYRAAGPMAALARRGHDVQPVRDPRARQTRDLLARADVLHVYRHCGPDTLSLVEAARTAGTGVVWDNDDDMGALPKSNPSYRRYGGINWERRLKAMRRVFGHTDRVTAPSATLAERLADAGAPHVQVIENFVADEFLLSPAHPAVPLTIGYVAGLEHRADLDAVPVQDALRRLLDERPDVRVTSVGLGLGIASDRYEHIDKVRFSDLVRTASRFAIGIAPLTDSPFNRARSNVKLKEYAAAGVPWLASPVGPYLGLGEHEGGRLVADGDWYEQLAALLDRQRDRRKLAKRAGRWIRSQTIDGNVSLWEDVLRDAAASAARR